MAYSYNVYTGNGSTTQFAVGFPYIRREHLVVSVNYVSTAFTWVNNTTVQVSPAPANAARVEVRRVTPVSAPLVDFTDGSTLVAADLNTVNLQQTYVNQEQDDQFQDAVFINAQGLLDAGGKRITNAGDPIAAQDVATKNYVETAVDNTYTGTPGFTQDGAGAVTRSWNSKLKDVVSVKDFGAVADCTGQGVGTDVIPAILAAVNHAINLGSGTQVVLPPGRYRASTSAVLDLAGKHFVELDFQGAITPDSTAMTVLTIRNGQFITLKASVLEGGIFNGWANPSPYGPCDYATQRNAAAAGGQEMFLVQGLINFTVDLRARSYAGRLLRTDERTSVSHPYTMAIKGQIKTERNVGDLSKPRTAQSLWADGGTTNPNIGNWGSLDRLVCDFDYWGPVWKRLNDIELGTLDCAFGFTGPTFRGCIVVTGNIWYVGDTDGGSGSRHMQFISEGGVDCAEVYVKQMLFLNKGPGLHMENVYSARVGVHHIGLNIGNVATFVNCIEVQAQLSANSGTAASLCEVSGAATNLLEIQCSSKGSTFSGHVVDIASSVTGIVILKPYLVNKTAARAAIKVAGAAQVRVIDPELSGTTGNIFDIASSSNNVLVYGGIVSTNSVTVYANSNPAAVVTGTIGLDQSNNFSLRSNVGGLSGGAGGSFDLGVGAAGHQNYSPMAKVKGLLVNNAGTELQGNLALQIRPLGSAGQSLMDAITASNTSTDGEMTAIVLARVSGAFVAKRVKFGGTNTGPGGAGRALYIDN